MPIAFDTTGLRQTDPSTWQAAGGDVVQLHYFNLVPDLPGSLRDQAGLRRAMAAACAAQGAALVEAWVLAVDSVPALFQIVKLPQPGRPAGVTFVGSFTFPKAACGAVLKLIAAEGPVTGTREAAVMAQVGPQGMVIAHPYAPDLPASAADDPAWDARFPDHPLTRVRAWAHRTVATARVDPGFAQLPEFDPAPPPQRAHPAPQAVPAPPAAPMPRPAPLPQRAPVPQPAPLPPAAPVPHAAPVPQQAPAPPAQEVPPRTQPPQVPPPQAQSAQPRPVQPDAPKSPAEVGDMLVSVALGLPLAGYLPVWHDGGLVSYWRMKDPAATLARLGRGVVSRAEVDTRRYRECAMLNAAGGTMLLLERFRSEGGGIAAENHDLEPATEEQARAAITDAALAELYEWIGECVLAAAQRGEFLAVESGGWTVPLRPCLLSMVRPHPNGQEVFSVVEASPVPVGAPIWVDDQPVDGDGQLLAAPSDDARLRAVGHLTRFAVDAWGVHPFELGLSFGPNPTISTAATG
ncbi:hypothetical protein [Actinokineospora iranica]|uniref:hypothetical protein n=1 Tax=Actinokineospora iranica TaxID=1271860 RepID=UPI0015871FC1|nr:hypothetical protein [Actinokineospora iranica]